jgi:catechol 2,3-dioxygenase-like lactoylglutathione lyase family enzyme
MIRGLHHGAIATNDVERLFAFYRDLFGLEVVLDYTWQDNVVADRVTALHGSSARSIMLRKGNAYLELFQYFSPQPAQGDAARRVCDPGITHLCFDVVDLDSEYERLSKAGMTFHCPPQVVGPGVRTTYGRDPDGNVIELQEVASGEHRIALPPLA